MKASKFRHLLPLAVCLSLAARAAGAGTGLDLARQLNQTFIEVAEQASRSVVVIVVKEKPAAFPEDSDEGNGDGRTNSSPRGFWRRFHEQFQDSTPEEGEGSGVILRKDGYILTSRHVVNNADEINVRLQDGRAFKAKLRGADAQSDVAVIKIDADNLPVATLADSSKVRIGEFAIAIGAPFGYDYTVTFGHVSAKGRANVVPMFEGGGAMDQDFIQTDANINPGNSGGPLLNIDGQVIGINTMIRGMQTGIGFAVPINLAREIADQLIAHGKFTRAWLGIAIRSRNDPRSIKEVLEAQAGTNEVNGGVIVDAIMPRGPSAGSELRPGDVITAVEGRSVNTPQQLRNEVRGKPIGQPITLSVLRGSKTVALKVKPGEYPETAIASIQAPPKREDSAPSGLGLTVHALTRELADQFGVDLTEGVIVVTVDRDSPAERKGIKPGDIVTAINQQKISSPKQFTDAVKKADLKKGVLVNLVNADSARFEILKEGDE